jgi:thiamine biosynthesis lipoprotein
MQRHVFRAMGTEIELLLDADATDGALAGAEDELRRLEGLLSRFRQESELSRLNRDGAIDAGADLLRVVELAVAARTYTRGRFDPTVHDALVAAGYDRTFDDVPRADATDARPPVAAGGGVRVVGSRIELDPGVRIDLGGIGKGYAAERAADLLGVAGPCLVNAGGDIATRGGSWRVGVDTPDGTITLDIRDAAVATSGTDRRSWRRAGRTLHHLIDPRTGAPATSDILRVTVVAPDAVAAEVAATSLFLSGARAAAAEADDAQLPTVIVDTDGRTILAGGLR